MAIYKTHVYTDDFNRTLVERKNIENEETPNYVGSVVIKTNQGNVPIEFPFVAAEEEELTIEKCFEVFDTTLQTFVAEKQKEAQSQIVTPEDGGVIAGPPIPQ